jgi:hypothetical protein
MRLRIFTMIGHTLSYEDQQSFHQINTNLIIGSTQVVRAVLPRLRDSTMQDAATFNIGVAIVGPDGTRTECRFGTSRLGPKMDASNDSRPA